MSGRVGKRRDEEGDGAVARYTFASPKGQIDEGTKREHKCVEVSLGDVPARIVYDAWDKC